MSVAEAAHRPAKSGRPVALWLGFLIIIAAGVGLAWLGAHSVRQRTVQVDTVTPGSGPFVQTPDGVLIDYEGKLDSGKVFDSSAGKGPVPVLVTQTIPGFAQALLKMQEGGHYQVRIPAKLGYGAHPPAGGPIPPNADLDFDVHVVKLVPNAALMQGGPPQGEGQPQSEGQPQGEQQPQR